MPENRAEHGARIDQLESRMDSLAKLVSELDEENEQIRAENEDLRDDVSILRRQLQQMEQDTSMLGDIRRGNASTRERRMAVVLLTLRNEAIRNGGKGRMDVKDCHSALNKEPDRTTMYGLMEDAARLVESDSVRFVKETRSAKQNTRIEMDESRGPLPTAFQGFDITGEEVA